MWTQLLADRAGRGRRRSSTASSRVTRTSSRPELVVEVAFTEWTGDGRLRHPVMLGRRDDVDPRAVRRETPSDQTGASSSSNKRPVAEHRVAEILGRGAAVAAAALQLVRGAVVLDEVGVVDRDERRLLVEAVDRVAPLAHHLVEQRLGVAERVLGRVDEAGLRVVPLVGVLLARRGAERADVELVAGLGPIGQLVLGVPTVLAASRPGRRCGPIRSRTAPAGRRRHGAGTPAAPGPGATSATTAAMTTIRTTVFTATLRGSASGRDIPAPRRRRNPGSTPRSRGAWPPVPPGARAGVTCLFVAIVRRFPFTVHEENLR